MTKDTKFFGYWLPVDDENSAREAVKMSGLPVLIMGANAGLFALMSAVAQYPNYIAAAIACGIAVILVVIAFRMRSGKAGLVPAMAAIFCLFLLLNILFSAFSFQISGGGSNNAIGIVISWIVPAFCAALAISGWRGWRWLKRNNLPTKF